MVCQILEMSVCILFPCFGDAVSVNVCVCRCGGGVCIHMCGVVMVCVCVCVHVSMCVCVCAKNVGSVTQKCEARKQSTQACSAHKATRKHHHALHIYSCNSEQ